MCVVFVFSSHLFWTLGLLDVPAEVTQEEGHTGFLIHLPSAVLALIFLARKISAIFLSLVDREVEFCGEEKSSYRDSNSRPNVSEGFEVTNRATGATGTLCMVTHIARVRINRVRLPALHVVS